jgi:hypothetical protein
MNVAPSLLRRLGIVMEPDLADPREAAGVLNPAVARGPDGQLYLLPRLVAPGNYSRIGLARVLCAPCGTPTGVQRLGAVLTPQASYELNTQSGGGVEDPRVTYLAARGHYVMLYTAFGPAGPRIAAAVSRDLVRWRRTGFVQFARLHGLDLATVDNKNGLLFPEPVSAPDGRPALALIHPAELPGAAARAAGTAPQHVAQLCPAGRPGGQTPGRLWAAPPASGAPAGLGVPQDRWGHATGPDP